MDGRHGYGGTRATRSSASGQLWLLTGLVAGWTVLFFSIAGSKRPGYILPALPPLAVLLAASVCRLAGRRPLLTQSLVVSMAALLVFAVNLWLPAYHDRFALRQAVRSGLAGAIHPPGGAGGVTVPIYSYPRRWDSISFYLQRQNVQAFTPAQVPELLAQLRPRGILRQSRSRPTRWPSYWPNFPPTCTSSYAGRPAG
jgi:hypothetical protein